jgi:Domain of unknown function (DUF4349)
MRNTRIFVGIAGLALVLAGCGGTSSGSASSGANSSGANRAMAAPAQPPSKVSGGTAQQVALAPNTGQMIIYTANLQVATANVGAATTQAKQIVGTAGGYISDENDMSTPGVAPSAAITFKVPVAQYPTVLAQLGTKLGRKVSLTQQAQDVTEQVADVNSRVQSAQATLASFRTLLSKATTIGDIINLEQEISQRETDLESLEAKQKALNHETSFATIALQLNGHLLPPKPKTHRHGFTAGLSSGWHAFTTAVGGIAIALGWLSPFLILALLIGIPAWRLRHKFRRAPQP